MKTHFPSRNYFSYQFFFMVQDTLLKFLKLKVPYQLHIDWPIDNQKSRKL